VAWRGGPPVPAAKKTLTEFSGTVCARWLKFLCRRDPAFKRDTTVLLREFAEREGYSLPELDLQFREEPVVKHLRLVQKMLDVTPLSPYSCT